MKLIPALAGATLALAFGLVSAQAQYYLPPEKVERNREKLARKQAEFYERYGYPQQRPGAVYRGGQPPPPAYRYAQPQPYGYAPPPRQVYRRPPPPAYEHDMPGYGYVQPAPRVYRRAPDYYYFDD